MKYRCNRYKYNSNKIFTNSYLILLSEHKLTLSVTTVRQSVLITVNTICIRKFGWQSIQSSLIYSCINIHSFTLNKIIYKVTKKRNNRNAKPQINHQPLPNSHILIVRYIFTTIILSLFCSKTSKSFCCQYELFIKTLVMFT